MQNFDDIKHYWLVSMRKHVSDNKYLTNYTQLSLSWKEHESNDQK
jgi:hypothetical protein